jgi:hypothetical protein
VLLVREVRSIGEGAGIPFFHTSFDIQCRIAFPVVKNEAVLFSLSGMAPLIERNGGAGVRSGSGSVIPPHPHLI